MKITALCLLLSAFFSNCSVSEDNAQLSASNSANKPNIILILADDMGYGDPGFNGGAIINTPVLAQLAGVCFNPYYSGSGIRGQ